MSNKKQLDNKKNKNILKKDENLNKNEKETKKNNSQKTEKKSIHNDIHNDDIKDMKKSIVKINYVEKNCLVVDLFGWSKRVYFDLDFKELDIIRNEPKKYSEKNVSIYYFGDIKNPFKVRILPLKSLSDIQNK